jgi:hypothetical protein
VTIEAVLNLSAQQVAGVPAQGRSKDGEVYWHGTQRGSVYLSHRKLLDLLMRGVTTRQYRT